MDSTSDKLKANAFLIRCFQVLSSHQEGTLRYRAIILHIEWLMRLLGFDTFRVTAETKRIKGGIERNRPATIDRELEAQLLWVVNHCQTMLCLPTEVEGDIRREAADDISTTLMTTYKCDRVMADQLRDLTRALVQEEKASPRHT
jgi:hypothetical protein